MEKDRQPAGKQEAGKMEPGKMQNPQGGAKQQTGSEKAQPKGAQTGKAQPQGSSLGQGMKSPSHEEKSGQHQQKSGKSEHPILGKQTESMENEEKERERLRIQQERFQEEGVKKDKPAA